MTEISNSKRQGLQDVLNLECAGIELVLNFLF